MGRILHRTEDAKANEKFVLPAKAGIQVRSSFKCKQHLDFGMRRNDGNESELSQRQFQIV
jgi:hypothetical protein